MEFCVNATFMINYLSALQVDDYLHLLPIKSLPGIGHVLEDKLKKRGVETCGKLRMISKVIFGVLIFIHLLGWFCCNIT